MNTNQITYDAITAEEQAQRMSHSAGAYVPVFNTRAVPGKSALKIQ